MENNIQKPKIIVVFLNLALIIFGLMWLKFSTPDTSESMALIFFDTGVIAFVVAVGIFECVWYVKKYVDYRFQELEKNLQRQSPDSPNENSK